MIGLRARQYWRRLELVPTALGTEHMDIKMEVLPSGQREGGYIWEVVSSKVNDVLNYFVRLEEEGYEITHTMEPYTARALMEATRHVTKGGYAVETTVQAWFDVEYLNTYPHVAPRVPIPSFVD